MKPRAALMSLAVLLGWSSELTAQSVAAHAMVGAPRSSVAVGDITERMSGVWGGLALELDAGRFALAASGTRGRIVPNVPRAFPAKDVGEISLSGRYQLRSRAALQVDYAARAFSSAAGYQRWNILGLGGELSRELGTPAVQGFASFAYLPFVLVSQQERPTFAVRSHVGISLAPQRFPLTCVLAYRVERFRFPDATARSEQFEALTLSVGVRATTGGDGRSG